MTVIFVWSYFDVMYSVWTIPLYAFGIFFILLLEEVRPDSYLYTN